MSRFLTAHQNN